MISAKEEKPEMLIGEFWVESVKKEAQVYCCWSTLELLQRMCRGVMHSGIKGSG